MYEYLDRKPEAGDIVECKINIPTFTKGKLYISKGIHPKNKHAIAVALDDIGSTTNGLSYTYFKVVKTLLGDQAKVGDTCIRVGKSLEDSPKGATFIVTHIYDGKIGYKKHHLTYPVNIRVLCLAETKPKAYYKRSGEPWTTEELKQIPNMWRIPTSTITLTYKWVYPNGSKEYCPWDSQLPETNPQEYNLVAFEDEFTSDEITVGSQWVRLTDYSTSKPKGEIVTITKHEPVTKEVYYTNGPYRTEQNFLEDFMPLHKYKQQNAKVVHKVCEDPFVDLVQPFLNQPTKPILKEKPMTAFQQLINSLFTEEIKTDYDKKPNFLVVIYNNEGTEIAQATADSIKQVEDKIQSTPKLWGAKAVIYSIDSEVQTAVPVTTTKLKKSK